MTLWQRRFLRRRMDEDRARDAVAVRAQLGSLTAEQLDAVLQVVQRIIDGRIEILAGGNSLETQVVHEMRGGIVSLREFSHALRELWVKLRDEQAAEESGDDA